MGASPLSFDIQIGETLHSFNFTGGMKSPVVKLPIYSTSDEAIQEILEDYPGFNVSFKISDETLGNIEEMKKNQWETKTFDTIKDAKNWINETHEIPFHKLTNLGYIKAEFEKLNLLLEIETLKK